MIAAMGVSITLVSSAAQAQDPPDIVWRGEGHADSVRGVAFSPDGQVLVSGDRDGVIQFWDAADGTPIRSINQGSQISCIAISPDGEILASSYNPIRLWRMSDGSLIRELDGRGDISFSPDGQILASGGDAGVIKLWRVSDGSLIRTIDTTGCNTVAFSPDGELLASGHTDDAVRLWRVANGELVRTLTGHRDTIMSLSFSPDGLRLASACQDRQPRVWQVSDGALLFTLSGGWGVSYSPDGRTLMTMSNSLSVYRAADGGHLATYRDKKAKDGTNPLSFTPDSRLFAYGHHSKDGWPKLAVARNLFGPDVCRYQLKRDAKSKGRCTTCPKKGDIIDGATLCNAPDDCDSKLRGDMHCPFRGGIACKKLKGKLIGCG